MHIPNLYQGLIKQEFKFWCKDGKFVNGGYGKISNISARVKGALYCFDSHSRIHMQAFPIHYKGGETPKTKKEDSKKLEEK